ncbi:threonine dehydratase, biosynthetic [Deinococcus proteolyticus MRP]|uniref:L-threonine dehydratase n=1 Tax=Deinococcus proteolyticus (strain ATCC 35074 / DSM 20540 / JCM 6276 / NBRC 101906 / NCIMB 13154 / VKM Ac-1939 / CCM 2703 / MRP) TaxID=693977 RepID=F0RJR1_DEIPM|nr:threonine dehydratase, biosynthetic [Deinococcus proteolyticus MRP]
MSAPPSQPPSPAGTSFASATPFGMDLVRDVLNSRVYDVAVRTPLQPAPRLSERLGQRVYFKREDQQPVFSFKLRGAYNRMAQLSEAERAAGVICASAGNHAQGVAYSAQQLGVRAVIVMPVTTPDIKVRACRDRGAEVILYGDSFSDAAAHAFEVQAERGLTFIHPFDDPAVIAGQGTVGLELLSQVQEGAYTVFVPVGGGGLIAGVAAFLGTLNPAVRIVGVEPEDSAAMSLSIQAGERVWLKQVGLFVDGVAVKQVGEHTFALCREYVHDWVTVTTDEVCAAIKDVFDDTRSIMEPAGALAVAGLKRYARQLEGTGQTLVALTCGANMNFDRLRHVAERAEVGEQKEAVLAVTIPEQPGAFVRFCGALGPLAVTEFNYRYAPRQDARIFVGVQLQRPGDRAAIVQRLEEAGYPVLDLTDDEVAGVHVRHMVGGRAPEALHERLYSFNFPERPGALLEFLLRLGQEWNISLFHYRNHGSDYGRVLAGIQVPLQDLSRFREALAGVGYDFTEQTANPAYRTFLQ